MTTRSLQPPGPKPLSSANSVQYVIGADGKPTAVLLSIAEWERIIEALEDAEDLEIVQRALDELEAAGGDPEKAGYISWEQARAEFERMSASEE